MTGSEVPLVVCVSSDTKFREWLVRQVDRRTPVLVCADLDELRAMLFRPSSPAAVEHRRPPVMESRPVSFGDLVVDAAAHQVTWRGDLLTTTRRERELLVRLAGRPLTVWPYERLFAEVWGGAYLGDTSILHSAVKRLRRKLAAIDGGPSVETVRGVGYRLVGLA